ncbi:MAG: hypothetical protein U1G08_08845 [Verrucomicrobiota bacterium]
MKSSWYSLFLVFVVMPGLASAELIPVSVRDPGSAVSSTASGASRFGEFADGGRYVFFLSEAPDLVADDRSGTIQDLFRRDLREKRTELISRATPGPLGYGPVGSFSVSGEGRRVAMEWGTDVPALLDTNGVPDVYVRDLTDGSLRLVSVRADGAGAGNAAARHPLISRDGRMIAFESASTNLVDAVDANGGTDVFLRDVASGRTELISVSAPGVASDSESTLLAMDEEASVLVMRNTSTNLGSMEGLPTELIIWRRGEPGLRRVVIPGAPISSFSKLLVVGDAVLSEDGSRMAFSLQFNLPALQETIGIWVLNLDTSEMTKVSGSQEVSPESLLLGPVQSRDGRTLAFEVGVGGAQNTGFQVRIWKEGFGLRSLSEWVDGGAGKEPASSADPILSPDGSSVMFVSDSPVPEAGVTEGGRWRWYSRILATGATRLVGSDESVDTLEFDDTGTRVVFSEQDPVLASGDNNELSDVVVLNLVDGVRELVSGAEPGAAGRTASGFSRGALRWSDDGRFLAFRSDAPDLVPGDTTGTLDAFVFDRITGKVEPASVTTNGTPAGRLLDGWLCADGSRLVFSSDRGDLTPGFTSTLAQVYVWDRATGTIELASTADGEAIPFQGGAVLLAASADGLAVGFSGGSTVLGPSSKGVYVRDLGTHRTWLLTNPFVFGIGLGAPSGMQLSADGKIALLLGFRGAGYVAVRTEQAWRKAFDVTARDALLCGDGRHLVYRRDRVDGNPGVFIQEIPTGTIRKLTDAIWTPREIRSTPDGSVILSVRPMDPPVVPGAAVMQVWAMRTETGEEELISRTPAGNPGSGDSRDTALSADGRFVVFRSTAADLVPGDSNAQQDIFVHDRYTGKTSLLSRSESGQLGNLLSTRPEISADGRFVSFTTFADNLFSGDGNGEGDVVMTPLVWEPAPDTDGDGLPDGWERDQFGSLSENAGGDPDGDGMNNAAEYAARTVPTDPASRWQVVASGEASHPKLEWTGHAGVSYRVEHREDLNGPGDWTPVGDLIPGHGGILQTELPDAAAGGFIRVVAE